MDTFELEYTETQIEYMRERLIQLGSCGSHQCFADYRDLPHYWEAEQIIEEFTKRKLEFPY